MTAPSRRPRTKSSSHGDTIRVWAAAYRNDPTAPNPERAAGLEQAAEYVDTLSLPARPALSGLPIASSPRDRIVASCNLLRDALLDAIPSYLPSFDLRRGDPPAIVPAPRQVTTLLDPPAPKPVPAPARRVADPPAPVPGRADRNAMTVLAAIAQRSPASRAQITVHTGYKRRKRDALLTELQNAGFVADGGPAGLQPTPEGRAALASAVIHNEVSELPFGEALAAWWLERLRPDERPIFEALLDRPTGVIHRTEITEHLGQKRRKRDANIRRLVGHGLVEASSRGIALSTAFRDLLGAR